MNSSDILLLSLCMLAVTNATVGAPVTSDAEGTFIIYRHDDKDYQNKIEILTENREQEARDIETTGTSPLPKCSLQMTNGVIFHDANVSCPLVKDVMKKLTSNITNGISFTSYPFNDTLFNGNSTLKTKCLLWYNESGSAISQELPCDFNGFVDRVNRTCSASPFTVPPAFMFAFAVLGICITLFMTVVSKLCYVCVCFRCCGRMQLTNVTVSFTDEDEFDALVEQEIEEIIESGMKSALD